MCTEPCLPVAQLDETTYLVCSTSTQELYTVLDDHDTMLCIVYWYTP